MIFNREEQHLMLEGSVLSKEDVKRLVALSHGGGIGIFCTNFTGFWKSGSVILLI